MAKHTEARGGAKAKEGKWKLALDRGAGYRQTMGDCKSKTRSPHNSDGGRHERYEDVGDNSGNDNLQGQG
jgi:hypothetical protein